MFWGKGPVHLEIDDDGSLNQRNNVGEEWKFKLDDG